MLSRRALIAGFAVLAATGATAAEADGPQAFMAGVYARLAKSRKASAEDFWQKPEARGAVFSAEVVKLWAKAEAKAQADGDIGPVDFDLFTNSQDAPPSATPTLAVTSEEAGRAHVRAVLRAPKGGGEPAPDDVLVFALVKVGAGWRIDDIHGTVSGDRWHLRGLLTMQ